MKKGTIGNSRITFLKRKEQEIRHQISAELAKTRRRDDRETGRAIQLAGKTVIDAAQNSPGFASVLKQLLDTSVTDTRSRELLRRKGLL